MDLPVDLLAPPRGARNRALLAALAAATGQASSLAVGPEGPDMTAMAFLRAGLATDAELVRAGWRVKASDKDAQLALKVRREWLNALRHAYIPVPTTTKFTATTKQSIYNIPLLPKLPPTAGHGQPV